MFINLYDIHQSYHHHVQNHHITIMFKTTVTLWLSYVIQSVINKPTQTLKITQHIPEVSHSEHTLHSICLPAGPAAIETIVQLAQQELETIVMTIADRLHQLFIITHIHKQVCHPPIEQS